MILSQNSLTAVSGPAVDEMIFFLEYCCERLKKNIWISIFFYNSRQRNFMWIFYKVTVIKQIKVCSAVAVALLC